MSDMVEIFSIVLHSNESDDNSSIIGGEISGAVIGNDYCGSSVFFKQEGGNSSDLVMPDGSLSITGPSRCLIGEEWFLRLKFNLKKNNKDLELCNGYIRVLPHDCEDYKDKTLSGLVRGRDGHALVNFVMFKYAVQAKLEISIVANGSVAPATVYGHIRAWNNAKIYWNCYDKKYFQTTMFNALQGKPCQLDSNKIPLSRRVTAVPLEGHLVMEAELFDGLTGFAIAGGRASFKARTCGTETRTIGYIQVKVTWAEHDLHPSHTKCPV